MITVHSLYPNREVAKKTARNLMEERKVAASYIKEVDACYIWDDKVNDDIQYDLELYTTLKNKDDVVNAIKKAHPYTNPMIRVENTTVSDNIELWVTAQCDL